MTRLISFWLVIFNLSSLGLAQNCLIADFPFNGNANDVSGNGNHGTVNGAMLTSDRYGNPNSAFFFDAIDDEIITNSTLGNFDTSNYTISCWIKTSANFSDGARFISKRPVCSSGVFYNIFLRANSAVRFEVQDGITQIGRSGVTVLNDGSWHHIAFLRSGLNYALFVDGTLEATAFTSYVLNSDNNAVLKFGNDVCAQIDDKYTGIIDDIKIFDCALNANEIAALYNDSLPCTIYDTTQVQIIDTTYISVYDTITVLDTIAVADTLIIDVVLSVNPVSTSKLKVYPNPTSNLLIIENNNHTQMTNYTLKITNVTGQEIFSSPFNAPSITVDLTQFGSTGLYFLQVLDPNSQVAEEKKIVLQ